MEVLASLPPMEVDWSATEPTWLVQLRQDVAELRTEVTQLRRENLELRQQAGYWRSQHAAAKQRIAALDQERAQLRGDQRKLQDQLFGRKSETASSRDRSNGLDGEEESVFPEPARRGQRTDRPGPKRRDYSHLPVVDDPRTSRRSCPGPCPEKNAVNWPSIPTTVREWHGPDRNQFDIEPDPQSGEDLVAPMLYA